MIEIKLHATHLSFELERDEDFFALGYKVLQKQPILNAIKGLKIKYNNKSKLLYSVENLLPIIEVIEGLSEIEIIQLMIDLLEAIRQTSENGFLPKEAVAVNTECLFWNAEKEHLRLIVLPISKEQEFEDGLSWIMRLRKSLNYLAGFLQKNKKERILVYFENMNAVPSDLDVIVRELHAMKSHNAGNTLEGYCDEEIPVTLVLNGEGAAGNIRILIDKQEFVVGKKKDSVDGYIGLSTSVSRMHCKIIRLQNRYYCMDLGSLNHTYVNDIMVGSGEKRELHDQDILRLADVELQVQMKRGGYR